MAATCGDGFVWSNVEPCDDGNEVDTDACTNACEKAVCGDGIVQAGVEECDDGNAVDTDACLVTCVSAKCGDGIVQEGIEGCDDGNLKDGDWCNSTCGRECIVGDAPMMFGDSCLAMFEEPMSWADAEATCSLLGAHLVSIWSVEENAAVFGQIVNDAWIGLTDQYSEGTFVWFEGTGSVRVPTYKNWQLTQPDNEPAGSGDCAVMTVTDGTWADQPCAEAHPFMCEYEW